MAQFDVYENIDAQDSALIPYLLDVQSNFLSEFATRLVIPLYVPDAIDIRMPERLVPAIQVRGSRFLALMPEIAGVRTTSLGNRVANVANSRDQIVSAIDLLITGI